MTPKGVVVFFKDTNTLKATVETWKKTGTWARLNEVKLCCVESQEPAEMKKALKDYTENVDNEGAALLLTMQGRCAENFNFRDNMTRSIIIVGAPYPEAGSKEIKARLKYSLQSFERVHKYTKAEATEAFMCEFASAVVNRLISLSIEHAHDYGAIVLIGKEYKCGSLLRHLPVWATANLHNSPGTSSFLPGLHKFFQKASVLRVKGLEKISTAAFDARQSEKAAARNMDLVAENQRLRKNIPSGTDRKFVALNKQRMQQQEEAQKRRQERMREEEERVEENIHSCPEDKNLIQPVTNTVDSNQDDLEKKMTKVKLNPSQAPTQSQQVAQSNEDDLMVTYVANSDKLRDSENCIPLSKILKTCNPQSKIMCNICYETDDRRFLVSKCGHISCEICWQHRLKELMECPVCKQKVRRKTLIEIVKD